MGGSRLLRAAVFGVAASTTLGLVGGVAHAGPSGPANFGVMEPTSDGCPWPDFLNGVLAQDGVQKCLPAQIPWGEHGVRIVADPLAATGVIPGAAGQVTFWCQSLVGLHYRITVQGLAPASVYPVTAHLAGTSTDLDLGTLRTDMGGNGVVGGVIRLAPGEYDARVSVGDVLQPDPSDPDIGFLVSVTP